MTDYGLLAPLWLALLPLAWLLPWWLGRRGRGLPRLGAPLALRFPGLSGRVDPATDATHRQRPPWLLLPVLGLLVLALAEPVRYGQPLDARPAPVDVVLLVDVSVSMTLRDYSLDGEPVDRLTMAKRLLDRFAAAFTGERLAVVVVGRPSAVWAPLTRDRALVRHLLGRLELTMAGRNAAIGDALALAVERFGAERPVVVLVSDAAYPLGRLSPAEGAARLAAAGMTLYTIGFGATGNAAADSGSGDLVFAAADLALLEEIATATGGRAFHAQDAQGMQDALGWIETTHSARRPAADAPRQRLALYPWPLGAALLLLAAWPLLGRLGRRSAAGEGE